MAEAVYENIKQLTETFCKTIDESVKNLDGTDLRVQYLILRTGSFVNYIENAGWSILKTMHRNGEINKQDFTKYWVEIIKEKQRAKEHLKSLEGKTSEKHDDKLIEAYKIKFIESTDE